MHRCYGAPFLCQSLLSALWEARVPTSKGLTLSLLGWKVVLLQKLFENWCLVEGFQKTVSPHGHFGVFMIK